MAVLRAKLIERQEEEREAEMLRLRGEHVEAGWGNQIRSYVLQPYTMVKDLRTGVETSNPDGRARRRPRRVHRGLPALAGRRRPRPGGARGVGAIGPSTVGSTSADTSRQQRAAVSRRAPPRCLVGMRDVRQLAPDRDEEQRRAGEGEPERRGDPELLGEHARRRAEPMTRPPKTPTVFTLPTRPWSSSGTARWRTVTDVVPHTKACMPKAKKMTIATTAFVVIARHEVGERLDDQPDAHDVAEADPAGDPAVGDGARGGRRAPRRSSAARSRSRRARAAPSRRARAPTTPRRR